MKSPIPAFVVGRRRYEIARARQAGPAHAQLLGPLSWPRSGGPGGKSTFQGSRPASEGGGYSCSELLFSLTILRSVPSLLFISTAQFLVPFLSFGFSNGPNLLRVSALRSRDRELSRATSVCVPFLQFLVCYIHRSLPVFIIVD